MVKPHVVQDRKVPKEKRRWSLACRGPHFYIAADELFPIPDSIYIRYARL
jgi:hypothetical protein